MINTATPEPPADGRVRLAILVVSASLALWLGPGPARAETIGYRIDLRACRGEVCRPMPPSARLWGGLYACQGRAALMDGHPLGRERVRARCVPVAGMPTA